MGHPLLPDLSATTEIEVAPGLSFRIGYIKPAKMTAIRVALARLPRVTEDAPEADRLNAIEPMFEAYREICRWGIKGWNIDDPMPMEDDSVRGRSVQVAADGVVEAIEERGWLASVATAILEYNTLDDASKKK